MDWSKIILLSSQLVISFSFTIDNLNIFTNESIIKVQSLSQSPFQNYGYWLSHKGTFSYSSLKGLLTEWVANLAIITYMIIGVAATEVAYRVGCKSSSHDLHDAWCGDDNGCLLGGLQRFSWKRFKILVDHDPQFRSKMNKFSLIIIIIITTTCYYQ